MKKVIVGIVFAVFAVVVFLLLTQSEDYKTFSSPDEVVPTYETAVNNLTLDGYSVRTEDTALDSDIKAKRLYADKGNSFIDICYNLSEDDAKVVFEKYRDKYENSSFYVLAQNGNYVYCVSDKSTFEICGFAGLANWGYQIIHNGF